MEHYETWSDGNGQINFYTKNPDVARILKKLVDRLTTYERNGNVFAWQCTMPKTKVRFVEMKLNQDLNVDNKEVTVIRKRKFQF